jgi:hypothetical protein
MMEMGSALQRLGASEADSLLEERCSRQQGIHGE